MKSTEKYIEIMEKLTGVAIGSQVTFDENVYELTDINAKELDAAVTLTCEGQDNISISLKDLIESEEHVIEKKVSEMSDEDEDYDKMSDEEKAAYDKKMKDSKKD